MKIFKANKIVCASIFFFSTVVITNCATSNNSSREGNVGTAVQLDEAKNFDESKDLTQHLSEISGLRVLGSGADARIRVRGGQNSFQLSSEPLYVVNNSAINGGYSVLYGMVDVSSIVKIKVLKGGDAALYGSRGSNGVIEIFTR